MIETIITTAETGLVTLWLFLLFVPYLTIRTYQALNGPLASPPGPMVSLFINLVLKYYVMTGRRMYYVDDLHKKYGKILRISPDETIVSDQQAVQWMHKINSGFTKSPFYSKFVAMRPAPGFSEIDPLIHRKRRRALGNNMTRSYLMQCEHIVPEKVQLSIEKMKREIEVEGTTDILKWSMFMFCDVISQLNFGDSFKLLETGQLGGYYHHMTLRTFLTLAQKNQFMRDQEQAQFVAGIAAEMSSIDVLLGKLGVPLFIELAAITVRSKRQGYDAVKQLKTREEAGGTR